MPEFTQTDIPTEAEADRVVNNYLADGCTTAEKQKQSDGKWKVIANCPDK